MRKKMNFLLTMHARLLITILLFFGALTLWGFVNYLRGQAISGGYRGALAIGELLMLAQCIIGVILLIGGRQPYREAIHILYGVVTVITLPGTFAYTRGRDTRWEQLIYAIVCLFLCGIALRALETGRVPGT
jgi:vacuolar-type H+-ATPase subunit I/STV1